jgi:hypothetical protein
MNKGDPQLTDECVKSTFACDAWNNRQRNFKIKTHVIFYLVFWGPAIKRGFVILFKTRKKWVFVFIYGIFRLMILSLFSLFSLFFRSYFAFISLLKA